MGEGPRGHERSAARVILDWASFLGDEEGVIARHVGQHLERADDVEQGEFAGRGRGQSAWLRSFLLRDWEAEHHPALVVLGDVAVRHPQAGVGDVEEDVDRLAGTNQHGVLPHQVWISLSIARDDKETSGAVDVEGMVHGMVLLHVVDQADLHLVTNSEGPVDLPVSYPSHRRRASRSCWWGPLPG